jgi:hypothetical protein
VAAPQMTMRPIASRETKRGGETPGAGAAVITRHRVVALAMAAQGFLNERGAPFNHKSIASMLAV